MKKFVFRLDRLLQWRATERDREEARLQGLVADLARLDAEARALERKSREAEASVARRDVLVEELRAIDGYRRFVDRERQRLARLRAEAQSRLEAQRRVLVEAERRVEALKRMREDRQAEWKAALDKEEEEMVSELVVANWNRRG